MRTEQKIFQVDAFTDRPFAGNPAGVCILEKPADEDWMQKVAAEMNLSETAFLYPEKDGYHLRWFTPAVEVDLCGHATLASSHILWETGIFRPDETARFYSLSGFLSAKKKGDWIEMNFPAEPDSPALLPEKIQKALGVPIRYSGKNRLDYLVEIESEDALKKLKPDFTMLEEATPRGLIVTCRSVNPEFDFVSRFFAPALGIKEDPVTGSAHCCLGPYWAKKLNKNEFTAFQASHRGGVVRVRVENNRILLSGQAVTVLTGKIIN